MQKRISGQIYSKQSGQNNEQAPSNELIRNLTKSLLQSNSSEQKPNNTNNEAAEIKNLLEKISSQLDCMQQNSGDETENKAQAAEPGNKSNEEQVTQQLQNLFKQLLQSEQGNNKQKIYQSNNDQQSSNQQSSNQQAADFSKQNRLTAQTAAQALAQAQYELSNELEASLKKLKQVISESEKLANKISDLLGEESNKQR